MSDISVTIADARAQAAEAGCDVIEGAESVLLLDYDNLEHAARFTHMRRKLDELFGVIEEQWWISKSGGEHRHCRIYLNAKLPATQRVALQAALGSDGYREMFAVRRLRLGVAEPSLLFKPKDSPIYGSLKAVNKATTLVPVSYTSPITDDEPF